MSERDDVAKAYKLPGMVDKGGQALFLLIVVLSLATLFMDDGIVSHIAFCLQVIAIVAYSVVVMVNDVFLWYEAERLRRVNAIENAFSIDVTGNQTKEYYNNRANDPMVSYSLNLYESCFFSYAIAKDMLPFETTKASIAIIVLLFSLMNANPSVVVVLAQGIFSVWVVLGFANLLAYCLRLKRISEDFYRVFVTHRFDGEGKERVELLAFATEYECVKAHYKVRLNSKTFYKLNHDLSKEWDRLTEKMEPALFDE